MQLNSLLRESDLIIFLLTLKWLVSSVGIQSTSVDSQLQ